MTPSTALFIAIVMVMMISVKGDYCNGTINIQQFNDTSLCDLCIEIGDIIQGINKIENGTIGVIEKMVEGLCELIGGEIIHQQCCIIINLIQFLFNMVISGVSPTQACQTLHFCS
jgi:hypothetical protein